MMELSHIYLIEAEGRAPQCCALNHMRAAVLLDQNFTSDPSRQNNI